MMDYGYMRIPRDIVPQEFIDEYGLERKFYKEFLYFEIRNGIYGLPQAGKLVNTILKQHLATCRYIECMHTPGFWRHIFCTVQFTLVVDNFGVKFVGVEQIQHLVESLKKFYEIVLYPTGRKYCRITLEWDYKNRTVQKLGNMKPPTPINTDNTTAKGIVHKTMKQK